MRILRLVWIYLQAVSRHWKAFVITGGPGALIAFAATVSGTDVPGWVWIATVAVGLVVAQFRAWAEVHRAEGGRVRLVEAWEPRYTRGNFFELWVFEASEVREGVMITLRGWQRDEVPDSAECTVEDVRGVEHIGKPTRGRSSSGKEWVRWVYPRDFEVEAESGLHYAKWLALGRHLPIGGAEPDEKYPWIDPVPFHIRVE